ncbi:hypothetical protein [Paraglaciecola sp. 25GB23A]|uniref:hypothetical protein n=1 Tax=Paraglaciecola sp. 25GB23A TaxID=3156068 RepID=UPI0032AEFBDF
MKRLIVVLTVGVTTLLMMQNAVAQSALTLIIQQPVTSTSQLEALANTEQMGLSVTREALSRIGSDIAKIAQIRLGKRVK